MSWLVLLTTAALAGDVYSMDELGSDALLVEATVVTTDCARFEVHESSVRVAYYLSTIAIEDVLNQDEGVTSLQAGDQLTVEWVETSYGAAGWPEGCAADTVYLMEGWSGPLHLIETGSDGPLRVDSSILESHAADLPEDGRLPECGHTEQREVIAELYDFDDDDDEDSNDESGPQPGTDTDLDDDEPASEPETPGYENSEARGAPKGGCSVVSGAPGLALAIPALLGLFRRRRSS